uniref:Uncharacterized protein LOC105436051 n=1 Tax=Rhizophora mucronata TaxID=61149 RepID=A0A2P2L757_RHIMU
MEIVRLARCVLADLIDFLLLFFFRNLMHAFITWIMVLSKGQLRIDPIPVQHFIYGRYLNGFCDLEILKERAIY